MSAYTNGLRAKVEKYKEDHAKAQAARTEAAQMVERLTAEITFVQGRIIEAEQIISELEEAEETSAKTQRLSTEEQEHAEAHQAQSNN